MIAHDVTVALVAGIPGVLASIFGIFNHDKLVRITISMNGRFDQLLNTAREKSFTEGRLSGIDEQKAVQKEELYTATPLVAPPINLTGTLTIQQPPSVISEEKS